MNKRIKVIVLAGGSGERFGLTKQFVPINGIPLFMYTLKKFAFFDIVLTVPKGFKRVVENTLNHFGYEDIVIVEGGDTRQESVKNALKVKGKCDYVLITDANRPLVSKDTIDKCVCLIEDYDAVITVCKSINTSCIIDKDVKILSRTNQYDLLMPQVFNYEKLFLSHIRTKLENCTDDLQIMQNFYSESISVKTLEISFWEGLKLTYPDDYIIFETLLGVEK